MVRAYLTLLLFEGFIAFLVLISIPGEGGSALFWGLSANRSALLALNFFVLGILAFIAYRCWRDTSWTEKIEEMLRNISNSAKLYFPILLVCVGGIIFSLYTILFSLKTTDLVLSAVLTRLSPNIVWLALTFVQSIALLRHHRTSQPMGTNQELSRIAKLAVGIGLVFNLMFFLMRSTGSGLKADIFGWGVAGVPVLPIQLFIAVLTAFATYFLWMRLHRMGQDENDQPTSGDWRKEKAILFLILWLIAVWQWEVQPASPSYFSSAPRAPNFETYPLSDAFNYDHSAQELLIGNTFDSSARRPAYSFFLAITENINSKVYSSRISTQILFLALIPPLLFLVTSQLHNPISGIIVALLIIFRERNSLALSGKIDVAHAKMMMSDLPTMLGVVLFTLIILKWLSNFSERSKGGWPLMAGGVLGLTMLIRTQVLILLPGLLIIAFVAYFPKKSDWLKKSVLFIAGLILILSPWYIRNFLREGNLLLVESSQIANLARYTNEANLPLDQIPRENSDEFLVQMAERARAFIRQEPGYVINFIISHFLHSQFQAFIYLPSYYPLVDNLVEFAGKLPYQRTNAAKLWGECCSLNNYVEALPYWEEWDGVILRETLLPLTLNGILIAFGLAICLRRNPLLGLIPLVILISYSLGNAMLRFSGWRFNLPVDWVSSLYLSVGISQLLIMAINYLAGRSLIAGFIRADDGEVKQSKLDRQSSRILISLGAALLLLGLMIPLSEALIPVRYAIDDQFAARENFLANPLTSSLATEEGIEIRIGRAVYPRYFEADSGEVGTSVAAFEKRDFGRIGFFLVGPLSQSVILPSKNNTLILAHSSDVAILGCRVDGYFVAYAIRVGVSRDIYFADEFLLPTRCDL